MRAHSMLGTVQAESISARAAANEMGIGPTPHNLTVRDEAGEVVMATADLSVDGTESITAELEPGEYTTFCSLEGHESLGMVGTLTVTES